MTRRQEKGWIAEAAVKRHYEQLGYEVRNLSQSEPATDLLIIHRGAVSGEAEVKYGRKPSELQREEKESIERRRLIVAPLGRFYTLWALIPTPGKGGRPIALRGTAYSVDGIESSKVRKGLSLRVFELLSVDLPMPEGGQWGSGSLLQTVTHSPPRAESRAVSQAQGETNGNGTRIERAAGLVESGDRRNSGEPESAHRARAPERGNGQGGRGRPQERAIAGVPASLPLQEVGGNPVLRPARPAIEEGGSGPYCARDHEEHRILNGRRIGRRDEASPWNDCPPASAIEEE